MATPGKFVSIVAEALGLPKPTVVLHDRYLVTAGFRTKGARGVNAPDVTERDAACLLTSILASSEIKDAVQSVRRYEKTRVAPGHESLKKCGIKELARLPIEHNFIDGLEALIASAASGNLRDVASSTPAIEVAALTPGTIGDIRIAGLQDKRTIHLRYALPTPWDKTRNPSEREIAAWEAKTNKEQATADLEQYRRISARTIFTLGETLGQPEGD